MIQHNSPKFHHQTENRARSKPLEKAATIHAGKKLEIFYCRCRKMKMNVQQKPKLLRGEGKSAWTAPLCCLNIYDATKRATAYVLITTTP